MKQKITNIVKKILFSLQIMTFCWLLIFNLLPKGHTCNHNILNFNNHSYSNSTIENTSFDKHDFSNEECFACTVFHSFQTFSFAEISDIKFDFLKYSNELIKIENSYSFLKIANPSLRAPPTYC